MSSRYLIFTLTDHRVANLLASLHVLHDIDGNGSLLETFQLQSLGRLASVLQPESHGYDASSLRNLRHTRIPGDRFVSDWNTLALSGRSRWVKQLIRVHMCQGTRSSESHIICVVGVSWTALMIIGLLLTLNRGHIGDFSNWSGWIAAER